MPIKSIGPALKTRQSYTTEYSSPSLSVVALKLIVLIQLTPQNSPIYFNFIRAVASSDVTILFELIELK